MTKHAAPNPPRTRRTRRNAKARTQYRQRAKLRATSTPGAVSSRPSTFRGPNPQIAAEVLTAADLMPHGTYLPAGICRTCGGGGWLVTASFVDTGRFRCNACGGTGKQAGQ